MVMSVPVHVHSSATFPSYMHVWLLKSKHPQPKAEVSNNTHAAVSPQIFACKVVAFAPQLGFTTACTPGFATEYK